ncbi:hypothetical protein [Frankia sp. AgB32]|uniref:hypothetical protein n=1 Tax=Frankia sp. AgB32 TaxID=631119 RepID=UPI00200CDD69|nr:hypothetical protein [Frankia sp. AgB32]MCK9893670.1 hypothetical protein [Frankia sp. AgB32]
MDDWADLFGGLPALTPLPVDEVLAHRPFLVSERTLGDEEEFHERAVGGVTFGRITPSIMPVEKLPASLRLRVGFEGARHLAVPIPFDLDELPGRLSYGRVSVRVTLDAVDAQALQFVPDRATVEVPTDGDEAEAPWRREFSGLASQFGEYVTARGARRGPPSEPRPVVTVFGPGSHVFGWTLQGQEGRPLWHRSVVGLVLLELPADTTELAGALTATAAVRRKRLGEFEDTPAPVRDAVRFHVALPPHRPTGT